MVDDEVGMVESLEIFLKKEGYIVDTATSGKEALERLKERHYDLLILDVRMEDIDGIEVLRRARNLSQDVTAIMISAYASPESAVSAMMEGAYDYLPKPFKIAELRRVIKEALGEKVGQGPYPDVKEAHYGYLVGESPGMKKVYQLIQKAAEITCNVLVLGESGTGKELVARAIHENSERRDKPFVVINCAGLPETLVESELFGYKKGAFTGALTDKVGYFQVADGGTVFLDEIGELTPTTQVKLLRFLQEKTFVAIGCTKERKVDVRVIAATNRDIEKEVVEKRFREDLYFRLNVLKIQIPPLRERKEDIELLANYFLKKYCKLYNKEIRKVSTYALEILRNYSFPGNVRELENIIERSVALESSKIILPDSLVLGYEGRKHEAEGAFHLRPLTVDAKDFDLDKALGEIEASYIISALELARGSKKRAAELLGINLRSLRYRLEKLGLRVKDTEN